MSNQERRARIAAITEERKRLGMTQRELADAAGVALKTVNNLESGRTYGQDGTVDKLARAVALDEPRSLDEPTHQLLAVIGPLIQQIPEDERATPIAQCVAILSAAIRR